MKFFCNLINWICGVKGEIRDIVSRNLDKKMLVNRERHPKTFLFFVVFSIAFVIYASVHFGIDVYNTYNWIAGLIQPSQTLIQTNQVTNECKKFNFTEWETGQGELIRDDNLWSLSATSSNGLLRYKEPVSLTSEIKVIFIPYSEEQINFALHVHDLYEVVIGDGGYQGVTLKVSPGNDQPMRIIENTDGHKRNIFKKGELAPGTDVTIILNHGISRIEDDSYEVNIRISYRYEIESAKDKLFATYDFPLPPKFNYEESSMRFSMGLLAADNNTNVSAEILCFGVK